LKDLQFSKTKFTIDKIISIESTKQAE